MSASLPFPVGMAANEPLLGYFGLINQSKGLDVLIGALLRLRQANPECRLLVIGGDAGASDNTNEQTRRAFLDSLAKNRLTDAVQLTGHLTSAEVSLALVSIDVCLLPYDQGVSLRRGSLMAALAHGCAIVTTDSKASINTAYPVSGGDSPGRDPVHGFPTIEPGHHALLVPAADASALAAATERLLRDAALTEQLRAGATELARAFTWDKIARAHLVLYNELVSGRSLSHVAA
jgi:glycosyltransferase involved in cell wall biosynthesis